MSWKARSTSVISSRPARGGFSGLPLAEPAGVVAEDGQALDDPLEEQEGQDQRRDHDRRAPADRASRPAAPRTRGGASIRCRSSPSSSPRISSMVARIASRSLRPAVESGHRPIPIGRSGPAAPRRRSSPGTASDPAGELGDPGLLPRDCPRPAPAAPRSAPAPAPGSARCRPEAAGSPEKTRLRTPRIALDQAAVQSPRPWR